VVQQASRTSAQMRVNRTLTALVAASLVGSAHQQYYSCTSDNQCKYQGCNDGRCNRYCEECFDGRGWSDCGCNRYCYSCGIPCYSYGICNDPPPCPSGQYSIGGGKNGGSDYACRSCEAGKFQSIAGASRCDNCVVAFTSFQFLSGRGRSARKVQSQSIERARSPHARL
jgi:hypothetical protein